MVYLSLTYDHRLIDGADAARYLTSVRTRLESWPRGAPADAGVSPSEASTATHR
jgi:2-oxoglutarate dehydrogenase E2 component (dihydrolipoamide succinyltransferase)